MHKAKIIIAIAILFIAALHICLFAETKIIIDHAGNKVEVPRKPKRIASLYTLSTSVMLWDLDAPLIGTATRLKSDENNRPYIRAVEEIYGIKFQDTTLANYGKFGEDIEQIKASKPDLIVGTQRHRKVYDKLSAIAPTILIHDMNDDQLKIYRDLSVWIGKKDVFDKKHKEYQNRLKQVKAKYLVSPSEQTVGYAHSYPGKAKYLARIHYGAFTQVAYDLGFKKLPFMQKYYKPDENSCCSGDKLSSETFGNFNPDWLLSTYRNQTSETIEDVYKGFDDIAPGWRSYNRAYKSNQIIAIYREMAYPMGFKSMNWVLDQFEKYAR